MLLVRSCSERLTMDAPVVDKDAGDNAGDESDDDGNIPTIMDLDRSAAEDLTTQVAQVAAPSTTTATLADLDKDLAKTLPFASEGGIDLKLLTNVLSPFDAIQEDDSTWDFDRLFTSIKSAIETEKEALEKAEELDAEAE